MPLRLNEGINCELCERIYFISDLIDVNTQECTGKWTGTGKEVLTDKDDNIGQCPGCYAYLTIYDVI